MKDSLAGRIKLGDEQAFELLIRKFYVMLCSFSNKFLGNPDDSKDTVQDVFIKIWEGRDNLNPDESIKSYIFSITYNLSIDKLRRRKVESKYAEIYKFIYLENTDYSVETSLITRELENKITQAIEKLPNKCRIIFKLNRIEGHKYREISEILQISPKTVEAQMSKALKELKISLKDYF